MPYLNLDLNYFEHIKTVRLIGLLGRGAAELPIRLWTYCGKHKAKDGSLAGYSAQEIESLVGWWGNRGECVAALVKLGFLDRTQEGYGIHDWSDHEGHLISFQERARSAAFARWEKARRQNATSMPQALLEHPPSNAPTVPAVPALPNQPYQTSSAGKKPPARAPKAPPKANGTPNWQKMIDHMDAAYHKKKGRPYVWSADPSALKDLKEVARVRGAHQVMACWDLHMRGEGYWSKQGKFDLEVFLRDFETLMDHLQRAGLAQKYLVAMDGPVAPDFKSLVSGLGKEISK